MPTKRTRITRDRRVDVPADVIAYLDDSEPTNIVEFFITDSNLRIAWNRVRDQILAGWIGTRPGTRPRYWWGCGDAPELRLRLGGIGQAAYEVTAHAEVYDHGLPAVWVMPGKKPHGAAAGATSPGETRSTPRGSTTPTAPGEPPRPARFGRARAPMARSTWRATCSSGPPRPSPGAGRR